MNTPGHADDASSPEKQARAIRVITDRQRRGLAVVSLQVMQEYFVAVTRKLGVDPELAQRKVELLGRGRVVRFAEGDVIAAIELHRLSHISFSRNASHAMVGEAIKRALELM